MGSVKSSSPCSSWRLLVHTDGPTDRSRHHFPAAVIQPVSGSHQPRPPAAATAALLDAADYRYRCGARKAARRTSNVLHSPEALKGVMAAKAQARSDAVTSRLLELQSARKDSAKLLAKVNGQHEKCHQKSPEVYLQQKQCEKLGILYQQAVNSANRESELADQVPISLCD